MGFHKQALASLPTEQRSSIARTKAGITRSDLIMRMAQKFPQLEIVDIDISVKAIIEAISNQLAKDNRVEIRMFGTFKTKYRSPRKCRNPKTGEPIYVEGRRVPYFKPSRLMQDILKNDEQD